MIYAADREYKQLRRERRRTAPQQVRMLLHDERVPNEHRDLFGLRTEMPYTAAERRYSSTVQARLEELLEGRRHEMLLLRRYHGDGKRMAVMPAPREVDRSQLRLAMVERILISLISFVRDVSPGGPVCQFDRDGSLVETQFFSTKYPHVVILREDAFSHATREPIYTEWRLRRTQNQRMETQINRWLEVTNLVISLVRNLQGPI